MVRALQLLIQPYRATAESNSFRGQVQIKSQQLDIDQQLWKLRLELAAVYHIWPELRFTFTVRDLRASSRVFSSSPGLLSDGQT